MNSVKIGLDFGTHQTKICVQRRPDEGHGEPYYEFFRFTDLLGEKQYFLPSVVQINEDDTLSYGYVNEQRRKHNVEIPTEEHIELEEEFDIPDEAERLYDKYANASNSPEDMHILGEALAIHLSKIRKRNIIKKTEADNRYQKKLQEYKEARNIFRYFKQATFSNSGWHRTSPISNRILCVWYLAYIIFLLEEKFGSDFSINMGIPADEASYKSKKRLAVEILASAYYLVEDVYQNDIDKFLNEKVDALLAKTVQRPYSDELKEEYWINVFPEAYAGLIALTSRRKLPTGMSITADIGGGTTDVSFFTIEDGMPMIYKYWSLPHGLNYVAEESGFDYADGNFAKRANPTVIADFNKEKQELVSNLATDLARKIKIETSIPVQNLRDALKDRILVYSGGGSTYNFLTKPIETFTDVRVVDSKIWNEENVKDKSDISQLSVLLTTAYGLSVSNDDSEVKLKSYSTLFSHLPKKIDYDIKEISKDVC